jgi:putative SOS response-associated peptidase YedK
MCNLHSITTNQAAILALFRVVNRYVGNLPPMPGVFPGLSSAGYSQCRRRARDGADRWGMPPPPRTGAPPVTNIHNTSSPHWRGCLKPENRCLVLFNSFAEYAPEPNASLGQRHRRSEKATRTFLCINQATKRECRVFQKGLGRSASVHGPVRSAS